MTIFNNGLVLHVGLPKTGTTTLQNAIFANHSQIRFLGKSIKSEFTGEKGCLSKDIYDVLWPLIFDLNKPYDAQAISKQCRDEIFSSTPADKCLLASWEALGGRSTTTYVKMLERLQTVFGSCRIIFTLRNPLTQVPSRYLQNIEGRFLRKNHKWMGSIRRVDIDGWFENRMSKDSFQSKSLSYSQNIRASVDLLGKENVGVFLFEELLEDPEVYYKAISDFIGIDVDEVYTLSQQEHFNKRLTQGQLERITQLSSSYIYRVIDHCLSPRRRKKLLEIVKSNPVPARVELTPELRDKIVDSTLEGHRWLVDNFDLPLAKFGYPL